MNCPQCGYMLFGLSEPRCPECGRPFEVTDFTFRPTAVHFLCRHCRQPYLGNDEHGLPRPSSFQCVRCRRYITAGTMIVQPIREDAAGESLRFGNAWELRDSAGRFRAFGQALAEIAGRPAEFFRVSYGTDNSGALTFGVLCSGITAAVLLLETAILLIYFPSPSVTPRQLFAPSTLMVLAVFVVLAAIVWAYVYTFLIHLTFGCLGIVKADLDQTLQVVAYSAAVLPAMIIPIVGLPWYLVTVAVGLERMHDLPHRRAMLAAVLPMLFWLGVIAGSIIYGFL